MSEIKFNYSLQHFYLKGKKIEIPEYPLTVTLQITRKCNLQCIYCSESNPIQDPSLDQINKMIKNLSGVNRIIISGGEPLLSKNLFSILKMCKNNFNVIALATNAVNIDLKMAKRLSNYVNYLDVTIDGPKNIHNKIRGSYDKVVDGLWNLKKAGVEFSIVMVLLKENKEYVPYVAQIADILGAKKLKILSPIPKGRGKNIVSKRLSSTEIRKLFNGLKKMKKKFGWDVRITLTDWEKIKEGHALLVHPNGEVVASPVWSRSSCIEHIGNIIKEDIKEIWVKNPYKKNHVKKYIEKTLMVC